MAEQVVRQLGDREHVHQVEEQLDVRDPLRAGTITQQPGGSRFSGGGRTSGIGFGQVAHGGTLTRRSAPGAGRYPGNRSSSRLSTSSSSTEGHRALRVVQLAQGARPDDRPGDALLMQQPGQRHVGRLLAELVAQVLVGRDPLAVPLHGLPGQAGQAAAPLALLLQHAAEQPALQRGPRDDADAVLDRRGQHLQLDLPGQQVVDRLLADQAEEPAGGRGVVGLGDVPAGEVGRADVQDLALGDEHLHRLPDLVPRSVPVDVVHLVQVDVVGAQPAQRRVAGPPDVQRGQLALVGPVAHRPVQLGGEHGALPPPAAAREPLADDLLGPAGMRLVVLGELTGRALHPAVAVGGVEEVDADLVRVIHDGVGFGEPGSAARSSWCRGRGGLRSGRNGQGGCIPCSYPFTAPRLHSWSPWPRGARPPARGCAGTRDHAAGDGTRGCAWHAPRLVRDNDLDFCYDGVMQRAQWWPIA